MHAIAQEETLCVPIYTRPSDVVRLYCANLHSSAWCQVRHKYVKMDSFVRSEPWQVFPINYVCINYPCNWALKSDLPEKKLGRYPECPLINSDFSFSWYVGSSSGRDWILANIGSRIYIVLGWYQPCMWSKKLRPKPTCTKTRAAFRVFLHNPKHLYSC